MTPIINTNTNMTPTRRDAVTGCFSSTAFGPKDYQYDLLRNSKGRRGSALQLRSFVAHNFAVEISDMSPLSHSNIAEEKPSSSEARRRKETGERYNRAMTFNDDVLAGKYPGTCDICNYHHNVIIIELENGNHIRTKPFSKHKTTIAKTRPGLLDFWESE
jgi:hypothetical protein